MKIRHIAMEFHGWSSAFSPEAIHAARQRGVRVTAGSRVRLAGPTGLALSWYRLRHRQKEIQMLDWAYVMKVMELAMGIEVKRGAQANENVE